MTGIMESPIRSGHRAVNLLKDLTQGVDPQRIKVETRPTSVVLTPLATDGFAVTLYDEGDEAMTAARRWHTHDHLPEQAAFGALWLLTPYYRVVEEFKGGLMVATWIERYEPSGWEGFAPVYFLNPEHPPSWELSGGETFVRQYTQQSVLFPPEPYDTIFSGIELDDNLLPPNSVLGTHSVEDRTSVGLSLFDPDDAEFEIEEA